MDIRMKLLVAVGATVVANCQSCLEEVADVAEGNGVEEEDLLEAVAVGKMVRDHSLAKMDRYAPTLFENPDSLARADRELEALVREFGSR